MANVSTNRIPVARQAGLTKNRIVDGVRLIVCAISECFTDKWVVGRIVCAGILDICGGKIIVNCCERSKSGLEFLWEGQLRVPLSASHEQTSVTLWWSLLMWIYIRTDIKLGKK